MKRIASFSLAIVLGLAHLWQEARAHEFWISPSDFTPGLGEVIDVRLREGEEFTGREIAYHNRRFHKFELLTPTGDEAIEGRNDDLPAARITTQSPGLHVLVYQSKLSLLTYDDLEQFGRFLKGKKLDFGLAQHQELGLPETAIREAYFRYAKALIEIEGSDHGKVTDRHLGMPFELVALDNPYQGADQLRVRLHLKDEIAANRPVFYFRRNKGELVKTWLETDDQGIATIPLAGGGDFQINAVHLQPASKRMNEVFGASWQTLWASMTLALPES